MSNKNSKIGCLLITHFGVKAEINKTPELSDKDIFLYSQELHHSPVVEDFSKRIKNISKGVPLSYALSRYPKSLKFEFDRKNYEQIFASVISNVARIAPKIERSELGVIYIDIQGLSRMYGGEAKLVTSILDSIPYFLEPRFGISVNKFSAYSAALSSIPGGSTKILNNIDSFLSSFSVDVLPIKKSTIIDFHKFGIHTIGDIARQDYGLIYAKFGNEGCRALSLSRADNSDYIYSDKPIENITEHVSLPFPTNSNSVLFTALELLVQKSFIRSVLKGRYVRKISILFELIGFSVWTKNLVLKNPLKNPHDLASLIRLELGDLKLPGLVENVSITISDFVGEYGVQYRAFTGIRDDIRDRKNKLIKTDRHIRKKMPAKNSLYKLLTVNPDHPIPERRAVQVSIDPETKFSVMAINIPKKIKVQELSNIPKFISLYGGDNLKVKVLDIWKIDLWWTQNPISRTYYNVSTPDNKVMTIFKDTVEKRWYRQNY
ncbi:MAG: hypothetical protein CL739_06990 [Chloroflexi bacterium]|nr:hypothetical protein [Chloroflexota bacterium]